MARQKGNPILPGGVERYGRAVMYKRRCRYSRKKTQVKPKKVQAPTTKTVKVGGANNGETRTVPLAKNSRYVVADAIRTPLPTHKTQRPAKIRSSITPGTILILVSGPYRGRRVVFLKALESGLLLVTGPFRVNGVPLRRVSQAYVIATSQSIDISKVTLDADLNDKFFSKKSGDRKPADFTDEAGKPKKVVSDKRKALQKDIDNQLIAVIKGVDNMTHYLKNRFTLGSGMFPHAMKF
eukprot:m.239604 g.239604  ORF g.239604 m.239604 type:complete len:238 (-) comp13945_c0_seq1:108-821(-)